MFGNIKSSLFFSFLFLFLFTISSCSKDEPLVPEDKTQKEQDKIEKNEDRVPLEFDDAEIIMDDWGKGKVSGEEKTDKTRVVTRVTNAGAFEDGDELYLWVVKRNGDQKGILLNKGNYADAMLHYFRGGKLYPKTSADNIYLSPTSKIDIYFLHVGNRTDLDLKGKGLKALENVPFVSNPKNIKDYEKNLFLWGKSDFGYDYQNKKLRSITFAREVTMFTATTEKLPTRYLDNIYIDVSANSSTFSPLSGVISSSLVGSNTTFRMLPISDSANRKVFACLLPANCQVKMIHFHDNKNGVKKVLSHKPPVITDVDFIKGQNNVLNVNYAKDVITWEYELSFDNKALTKITDLGNNYYFLITSRGEEKIMTITSLRKELKNGVLTGKVENVPYTITFEGQDANVFRVDGNRIGAIENTTNNRKFGVAVITQDGGATKRFRVLQEGKVSVIVNT